MRSHSIQCCFISSIVAVIGAALALAVANAEATFYNFTNIADTTTAAPNGNFIGFGQKQLTPAISGSKVAFAGQYFDVDGVNGHFGIFTGSGGELTTIVKPGDPAPVGAFDELGIDMFGISGDTVAFGAGYDAGVGTFTGIFTGNGGPLTTIVKTGDPAPIGTFFGVGTSVAIDGNAEAFYGVYDDGEVLRSGIFKSNGVAVTEIVDFTSHVFFASARPTISGGTVAMQITYDGPLGPDAIVTGNGGALTTIAAVGDPSPVGTFTDFLDGASISGNNVAFLGYYGASEEGVFVGNGGSLTTIAKSGDPAPIGTFSSGFFVDPNDGASISGNMVAFAANYSAPGFGNSGAGILIGNGGPLTTVIKTGDSLFGSTIQNLDMGRFGLDPDGSGNVAFTYWLTDGRTGVAVANPTNLPHLHGDFK